MLDSPSTSCAPVARHALDPALPPDAASIDPSGRPTDLERGEGEVRAGWMARSATAAETTAPGGPQRCTEGEGKRVAGVPGAGNAGMVVATRGVGGGKEFMVKLPAVARKYDTLYETAFTRTLLFGCQLRNQYESNTNSLVCMSRHS